MLLILDLKSPCEAASISIDGERTHPLCYSMHQANAIFKRANARNRPANLRGRRRYKHPSHPLVRELTDLVSLQKDPLPSVFSCLFCNHEKSVTIRMDKKGGVGQLNCRVCGQAYQCNINCEFRPSGGASSREPHTRADWR